MDNMYKYLRQKLHEAQLELSTLSDIAESFFPPESSPGTTRRTRSIDENVPHNRTRQLFGAVAALATGTGFILGEPIKDAASNALIFYLNICDSTEHLERELDEVTKQHKAQQQAFQTVQNENNEKFAQLREIRLTQESVERIKVDICTHISYMVEHIYTFEDVFRCYQFESAYRHFLQSLQLHLS